jgi:PAS domain S-box-containing protein
LHRRDERGANLGQDAAVRMENGRTGGEAKVAPHDLGEPALRDLVDAAFDALVISHAGKVIFANRSFQEMYGATADEIVGCSVLDFVAPEARHLVMASMAGSGDTRYESVGMRRDGSRIDVEICARTGTYDGKSVRISAIRVITERKLAEQTLRRSEARLRRLFERIQDAIIVERGGAVVFANPAALQYLDYPSLADITGTSVETLIHPGDRAAVRAAQTHGPDDPTPSLVTARIVRRDGSIGTAEIATASIDELDGAPANVLLARDVSERMRMETRLVQVDLLSSIGTLAAAIAHEINNPLAYVSLNLRLMAEKVAALGATTDGADRSRALELHRELEDLLAVTQDGAGRVQQIVRDVRVFARGSTEVRSPVNLPRVLDSTIQLAWNSIRHRAHLVRDYQPVPRVDADEPRLGQLFLNLLINALHAVDDDVDAGRTAEIRVRTDTAADGAAIIEITDTGHGIAPDVLGRVFEPFYTTKPPGVGTGLGLPICRAIVSSFRGTIELDSTLGEGTTCRITLPPAGTTHAAEPPPARALERASTRRRLNLLIVDDEPSLLRSLANLLGHEHDVRCTASGDEAIALILGGTFDAVLCDVMMPHTSGMDVFHATARERPDLARRVVFMTGGAFTPAARHFLASVPNRRLEKPFTFEELERALADLA